MKKLSTDSSDGVRLPVCRVLADRDERMDLSALCWALRKLRDGNSVQLLVRHDDHYAVHQVGAEFLQIFKMMTIQGEHYEVVSHFADGRKKDGLLRLDISPRGQVIDSQLDRQDEQVDKRDHDPFAAKRDI